MGWTTFNRPNGETMRDTFMKEFGIKEGEDRQILDIATVLPYVYIAMQTKPGEVHCAIVEVKFYRGFSHNFGYKDMDEGMGIWTANRCPARILDLLTPTRDATEIEWRASCREELAKTRPRLIDGHWLKLSEPLLFRDGVQRQTFSIQKMGKSWYFVGEDYQPCTISGLRSRNYTVHEAKP